MLLNTTTALLILTSAARKTLPANETLSYPQLVNDSFVIEIIRSVHETYVFKNFIFYITENLDLASDTAIRFFQNFWGTFPTVPRIIIGRGEAKGFLMDGFISTPCLVLVLATDCNDPIMELAAASLHGVRVLKTLFIIFPVMETDNFYGSFEDFSHFWRIIRNTYDWIWRQQFLNTVLLTIRNQVYLLDPYPTKKIINKTDHWHVDDFFVDLSRDFKGYLLETPIRYDLPRVFERVRKNGKLLVSGTSGQLITSFMASINATLNDTTEMSSPTEPFDLNRVLSLVSDKTLEMSIHSYTAMVSAVDVGSSYPIGINDWCIMVPYRNRSPEHLYLQNVFAHSSWLLIGFSYFYITVIIHIFSPQRPRDVSAALLQAMCSIVSIPPTAILVVAKTRMRYLYVLLFVLGFILSNMYTSKITSYLSTSLQQQQINTVKDVIAANLRIKLYDYEYEKLESLPQYYPKRFLDQLDIVDKPFLDAHRDHLNMSFGYSIQTDRWQFLNIQQRFLKKPLFRLSQICIGPYYHVFPMQTDSHLQMPFKYFIMYAGQSGFLEHWQQSSFADALRLKYVQMMMVFEEPPPLSLRFFRPIWHVWWFGLIVSGLVFVVEMKWLDVQELRQQILRLLARMHMKFEQLSVR